MADDPLFSGPERDALSPELVSQFGFKVARRGYAQTEVRQFLRRVSDELFSLRADLEQTHAARRAAEARANSPALDEEALMAAVGQETADILRSARRAAAEMSDRAGAQAARLVDEAQVAAGELRARAETILAEASAEAETAAEQILAAARLEAADLITRAADDARAIRHEAEGDRRSIVEGAQVARDTILMDLSRRRRVAAIQIEQLRAGRERLLESYSVVRRTLEEVHDELARADDDARAAADEAGRRAEQRAALADARVPVARHADAPEPAETTGGIAAAAANPEPDLDPDDPEPTELDPADPEPAEPEPAEPEPAEPEPIPQEPYAPPAETDLVVEGLFERLRNGRADAVGNARQVLEEAPPDEETLLQRRDRAVIDIEVGLTRKLKRALQDEQNDLLDRLRGLRGSPTAERLLPGEGEQAVRFASAARPLLADAARAGAAMITELYGEEGQDAEAFRVPDLDDLATELAATITGPLRRRLEQAVLDSAGDDQAVLVEGLGAPYREWKSQRIERVAGDIIAAAFARGGWVPVPKGGRLRWVVEDLDGACPDCDDNALAGGLLKGEPFPTGQAHPPAHTGCRCLLVPVIG